MENNIIEFPTITKNEEIEILQHMIVKVRESGAVYLYDTLMSLAMPFEMDIRSDMPGEITVHRLNYIKQEVDEKRQELLDIEKSLVCAEKRLRDIEESALTMERRRDSVINDIANLKESLRNL